MTREGDESNRRTRNGSGGDFMVMDRVVVKIPLTESRCRERVWTSVMWERRIGVKGSVNFRKAADVTRDHGCR